MRYSTILFDLDDTLLDTHSSADTAWSATMASIGIAAHDEYRDIFVAINNRLWHAVEDGTVTPDQVRNARFAEFVDATDIDADPVALADIYTHALGANGELYPGAYGMLEHLTTNAALALITNGIGEVQRARIERLDIERFFDSIIISGEVGVSKPGTDIFDLVFTDLAGPAKDTALIVGDNLRSDIAGGRAYGIATCWYNPNGHPEPSEAITHVIGDLSELIPIADGIED